ncbi:cyclin-domain-containing protein [Umbelopsis sp. PMI_123]|nr:cyclin-domain-containing protein [Umbelopsis sp. PMI_123]
MSETIRFDLGTNPTDVTIEALALLLTKITTANDKLIANERQEYHSTHKRPSSQTRSACFHARSVPSIGILPYLQRINRYCPAANEVFLSLLIYFDRMAQSAVNMRIDSFNIHRLIISGVTVASKLFSDTFFTNTRYAKVGGLPVAELNNLELEFLHLNNFDIYISVEELQEYGDQLLKHWDNHEAENGQKSPSKRKLSYPLPEQKEPPRSQDHDARKVEADILKNDTVRMRQLSIDDGTGTGRRRSSNPALSPVTPTPNPTAPHASESTRYMGHGNPTTQQPDGVFLHKGQPSLHGNVAHQFT